MALQESSKRTVPTTPGVTTATHLHSDTADADSTADLRAPVLAALAANAQDRTNATEPDHHAPLLRRRAQLWETLAQIDRHRPDLAQAWREAAAVCRQEADSLDPSSPNGWWMKKQHEVKNAA